MHDVISLSIVLLNVGYLEFLLGRLYYSIVASSEMSGSVCLYVCLYVYMCTLPWPDHSRLRSETFII